MRELSKEKRWCPKCGAWLFISVGGRKIANLFEPALATVRALFNTLAITYAGDLLFHGVDEKGAIARHPDALQRAFLAGQKLVELNAKNAK